MYVRELIGNALRFIGVSTTGVENLSGTEFKQNLQQLRLLADGLRLTYPFRVTQILTQSDLLEVPFVSIDSMQSTLDPGTDIQYIMQELDLDSFNYQTQVPNVGGIPQFYYFQKPSLVKVFPTQSEYVYIVVGKINTALTLTANTQLDPSPGFFQDFLGLSLAKRLAPFYTKEWTRERNNEWLEAKTNLETSTDFDYSISSTDNNWRNLRVRFLTTHA